MAALNTYMHLVVWSRHLCAEAEEIGVNVADVLAGTQVESADLSNPDFLVSARDEITMVRNLLRAAPDEPLVAARVGTRASLTNFGLLGLAVMSCGSFREMIAVGLQFFALTSLHVIFDVEESDGWCDISISAAHLPLDVRDFFIERDSVGILSNVAPFATSVIAEFIEEAHVDYVGTRESVEPILAGLPARVASITCGADRTCIRFPAELLDEPLPRADQYTLAACIGHCEELLERRAVRTGLSSAVRTMLLERQSDMPALEQTASAFRMHPRTLRRQLAIEQTSYRELIEETRATLAADLLSRVGLTVAQTAQHLGYSDPGSFTRAFKRWHGVTPSRYRK